MSVVTLVDSHCHLNYLAEGEPFDVNKVSPYVKRAKDAGVDKFLCIGVDVEKMPEVIEVASFFDEVKASAGVHPSDCLGMTREKKDALEKFVSHDQVIAVGETGLDYYREEGLNKALQQENFIWQIGLSLKYNKPLVVHTRMAREDTIICLKEHGKAKCRGVMHCFTESVEMARKALDLGMYISFSGIITFKNADEVREVLDYVPLDRVLVETDSPYLAPVPYRGKPNEPLYVVEVAKMMAKIKSVEYEQICYQTTKNFLELFSWHN